VFWSDYWGALSSRQRIGLIAGAVLIVVVAIGSAWWLLRDPYVPLASGLTSERLNELAQELERAKLSYRVGSGADAVTVPQSQLGKARAAAAGGEFAVPPSVGLELFKETDFSTTDFAQRINYQRALQGELTRTIQTIAGVRSARVHVILADSALLKRNAAKASAAVSVMLHPGHQLTRAQVRGIQRLVAASVPEVKVDDVVVLDESGASLTRAPNEAEGDLSSAQLDLKRQADQYFESKLARLLQELAPRGVVSLSVDATLDYKQLRVTTEEPIATRAPTEKGQATGVLVKERQSQRGRGTGLLQTGDYGGDYADADSTDSEYEYKVGHRIEQTLLAPGTIKRVSVAVALQGAPAEFSASDIELLVAHAVGIDRSRGDSVAVMVLPAVMAGGSGPDAVVSSRSPERADGSDAQLQPQGTGKKRSTSNISVAALAAVALVALLAAVMGWARLRAQSRTRRAAAGAEADIDAMAAKVRRWLSEGAGNGRT
jgi:flagellar M-ring protein FliF